MDFGSALKALKAGSRAARTGWNGVGMWVILVHPEEMDPNPDIHQAAAYMLTAEPAEIVGCRPWLGMKTANDEFVPWVASQTDLLADDWEVA